MNPKSHIRVRKNKETMEEEFKIVPTAGNTTAYCPKVFSIGQIIFGTIVASPIAGLVMMIWNYFAFKQFRKAYLATAISAIALSVYFALTVAVLHKIPVIFHIIFSMVLVATAAFMLQGYVEKRIDQHEATKISLFIVIAVFFFILLLVSVISYFSI